MRLLLIDDDPRYLALVRHHVTCAWADATVDGYNPRVRGPLLPEFLAQGYDTVLVDFGWKGGDALAWLCELAARPGFAPLIFLAEAADSPAALAARDAGVVDVVVARKLDHEHLLAAIRSAALRQRAAQAAWRGADGAREAQTFNGAFLRGYRRVRRVAAGSVSELFLAESVDAAALVALKVTRDVRRADGIDQTFARFLQEYEIIRGIRHAHVVRLHDLGVTDDYAYLVMEYFSRGDLRGQMTGPLPPLRALGYALEIAQALEAIHRAGIQHRDLKPGNVMIRDDGSLALIDFGLAKQQALEMEITDKGLIFGTPHYMSPEQGHARVTDGRSDLYSAGVVLYEMLAGRKPYEADTAMGLIYKHAKAPVPSLPESLLSLQPLIERLLAKRPEDRFESAAVAAAAIRRCIEEQRRAELAA